MPKGKGGEGGEPSSPKKKTQLKFTAPKTGEKKVVPDFEFIDDSDDLLTGDVKGEDFTSGKKEAGAINKLIDSVKRISDVNESVEKYNSSHVEILNTMLKKLKDIKIVADNFIKEQQGETSDIIKERKIVKEEYDQKRKEIIKEILNNTDKISEINITQTTDNISKPKKLSSIRGKKLDEVNNRYEVINTIDNNINSLDDFIKTKTQKIKSAIELITKVKKKYGTGIGTPLDTIPEEPDEKRMDFQMNPVLKEELKQKVAKIVADSNSQHQQKTSRSRSRSPGKGKGGR